MPDLEVEIIKIQITMKKAHDLQEPQKQALNIPVVMPSFDSPKNWTTDYNQENGNYTCKCYKCKELFFGNKHRILCKECYDKGLF